MKANILNFRMLPFVALISVLLSSCLGYKDIVNFQDGNDLDKGKVDSIMNFAPVRLKPDDIVMIVVSGYNSEETDKFNLADMRTLVQAGRGAGGATEPLGYRVDPQGNIDLPVIGRIYVRDLTMDELRALVYKKIEDTQFLTDYTVEVRYLTFRITVLGEVNLPGTYVINNTRITALEAIGLAKDLSIFSNRDNVLIIRESEGKRTYGRLNFKSKEVFNSSYYYLQPNDIVYVEPHKSRILATPDPLTRYVGTIVALTTLILLMIQLF
jgi:polysaccharide export outer membrane protein